MSSYRQHGRCEGDRAEPKSPDTCGCGQQSSGTSRREFIKLAGGAAASILSAGPMTPPAGAAEGLAPDHLVPVDKGLDPTWVEALTAKGQSTQYRGDDLDTIAMPIGGICAGQVYLSGDGRLMHWDVFNIRNFTGYGKDSYTARRKPQSPLAQGAAIEVKTPQNTWKRTLDRAGFPKVSFCGEYPIGTIQYADEGLPVRVTLEAFSPFVPLNAADSALPATILHYTVTNTSPQTVDVALCGWLENGVCLESGRQMPGARVNRVLKRPAFTMVLGEAKATTPARPARPPEVFADFEGGDYGAWTVEGEAFGKGPAAGTLAGQQQVSGFRGKGLVNTYLGGDGPRGRLLSPEFTIDRPWISFLVGGGSQAGKTCVNLLVDGKPSRTATGKDNERLDWHNWNVADLKGKQARLEIVDQASGGWGHVNVDQIEFGDVPRSPKSGKLEDEPDFGTMGLAVLGPPEGAIATAAVQLDEQGSPILPFNEQGQQERPFGQPLSGGVGRRMTLRPGEANEVTLVAAWCFPNRPENGNFYATRQSNAAEVAGYVAENFDRLAAATRLWHDTWYDSTLPCWLLDRLMSTASTLATSTCQWWANGRFWAWEGVGCCHGTCAHVWNYEHTMARLFPELERSVRQMQDFNPEAGFVEETGMIRFRGEGWQLWAGDGQAGTVLKAYREHLVSADDGFLKRNWPRIRKSLDFLIGQDRLAPDQDADGILEGKQHNTYDIDFYGANTMVGSLYLAALRAGEEMARELGDDRFAGLCRRLFDSGSRISSEKLFSGEYFVQEVDSAEHPKFQYGGGCLADQLFGQSWAHQVGLGHVYPKPQVDAALAAVWRYDWAPDVGPHNRVHPPERWFAQPGEGGLFICTWPHGGRPQEPVRYRDEVWTGIEYQVAANMASDGMPTEALAICRAIHDRYHPSKRNPFNEVECGDHYARAMASHGVLLALCGFEYHGPNGHLGFAPRLGPDDFRAAFTAAEGWGTISQRREPAGQTNRIDVKWGRLALRSLAFELPPQAALDRAEVTVAGTPVACTAQQDGRRVAIALAEAAEVGPGEAVEVQLRFAKSRE